MESIMRRSTLWGCNAAVMKQRWTVEEESIWDKPSTNTHSAVAMGGSLSQSRKGSIGSPQKKSSMWVHVFVYMFVCVDLESSVALIYRRREMEAQELEGWTLLPAWLKLMASSWLLFTPHCSQPLLPAIWIQSMYSNIKRGKGKTEELYSWWL